MTLNRTFALFALASFLFPEVAGAPIGKFFIIRGNHKALPENHTPIKETPINAEYTLVFEFQNWDTNKPIAIKVSHEYPDGETKDFDVNRFSAGASSGACLIGMKRSDRDVPGTYLWRLRVVGMGTFEQRLSLLPETPEIVAAGAPYERAAERQRSRTCVACPVTAYCRAFGSISLDFDDLINP